MQQKIELNFLTNFSKLLEHQALMTEAMTKLICKYEIMIETHRSILATLCRIEDKVENIKTQEEDLS